MARGVLGRAVDQGVAVRRRRDYLMAPGQVALGVRESARGDLISRPSGQAGLVPMSLRAVQHRLRPTSCGIAIARAWCTVVRPMP